MSPKFELKSLQYCILFLRRGFNVHVYTFCFSMRPNIFLGISEGSAQYRKWYYELMVDHLEPFVTAESTHLRVGWASTEGYSPYPGGGAEWGGNGVGDDLYSYGFDGLHLWSGTFSFFFLFSLLFYAYVIQGS